MKTPLSKYWVGFAGLGTGAVFFAALFALSLIHPPAFEGLRWRLDMRSHQYHAYIETAHRHHMRKLSVTDDRATIFLGDSHVEFLNVGAVADNAVNLGIGGLTAGDLLRFLPDYEKDLTERRMIVGIGANDLARTSKERTQSRLGKLIFTLNERGVDWYLLGIPPVNETLMDGVKNADINAINNFLTNACVKPCTFAPISDALTDERGDLDRDLSLDDGLHLNKRGYELLVQTLRKALDEDERI